MPSGTQSAKAAKRRITSAVGKLVSCSPNPQHCGGTGGCDGSTQELAFTYTRAVEVNLELLTILRRLGALTRDCRAQPLYLGSLIFQCSCLLFLLLCQRIC